MTLNYQANRLLTKLRMFIKQQTMKKKKMKLKISKNIKNNYKIMTQHAHSL